ncbi:hypothetical protein BHE74_00013467 [Ensete ventricosum]|nr:hypothetical protein BHE74_00013467 [Ensete ventricosum]
MQARAIISAAERETEAKKQSDRRPDSSSLPPPPAPAPPRVLNRSLSMKRSLQTFLQNRKTRAVDSSSPPYDERFGNPRFVAEFLVSEIRDRFDLCMCIRRIGFYVSDGVGLSVKITVVVFHTGSR